VIISQTINHFYSTPNASTSLNYVGYLPAFSFCFVVLSYFIEKIISNRSKRKQIVREWYNKSLLEPSLQPINALFEDIKYLTYKHLEVFEYKQTTLTRSEFLRYKGEINSQFQKIKEVFYNETLLPIFQNYPDIAESASGFLLSIQDSYVILFGGNSIDSDLFSLFINDLYIEKGKVLATLKKPLFYTKFDFMIERVGQWFRK
jgi:hypothetical protein